ncbi:MAG: TolC family protein, partial [Lentisphaerae bacterium]
MIGLELVLVLGSGCALQREYAELERAYRQGEETPYLRETLHALDHSQAAPVDGEKLSIAPAQDALKTIDATYQRLLGQVAQTEKLRHAAVKPFLTAKGREKIVRYLHMNDAERERQLAREADEWLLVVQALLHNPGLASARNRWQASIERYPQAMALDDLLRQYNAFTRQLNLQITRQRQKSMVAMEFPFPDMLALKGGIATREAEAARVSYEKALRDLVAEIRDNCAQLRYLQEAQQLLQTLKVTLETTMNSVRQGVESGRFQYAEYLMLRSELRRLEEQLTTLHGEELVTRTRLNALMKRQADRSIILKKTTDDIPALPPLPELRKLALTHRQELRMLEHRLESMRLMVKMTANASRLEASSGFSYFEYRALPEKRKMPKGFMT